jgi:dynein heavy chain
MDKTVSFVKSKCSEYEKVPEPSFAMNTLRFLKGMLKENVTEEQHRRMEELLLRVDALFIYALMWTVGGAVDESGRKTFDSYFKKLLREPLKSETKKDRLVKFDRPSVIPELSQTLAYDFYYDYAESRWRNWKDNLKEPVIPMETQYNSIMVETTESIRVTSLLAAAT